MLWDFLWYQFPNFSCMRLKNKSKHSILLRTDVFEPWVQELKNFTCWLNFNAFRFPEVARPSFHPIQICVPHLCWFTVRVSCHRTNLHLYSLCLSQRRSIMPMLNERFIGSMKILLFELKFSNSDSTKRSTRANYGFKY